MNSKRIITALVTSLCLFIAASLSAQHSPSQTIPRAVSPTKQSVQPIPGTMQIGHNISDPLVYLYLPGINFAAPYTVYWVFGDGNKAVTYSNYVSHIYEAPGNYIVQARVVFSTGGTMTGSTMIHIDGKPGNPSGPTDPIKHRRSIL